MSSQRPIAEIVSDPSATEAEIRRMALSFPAYAVDHPNCPSDLWWEHAARHPLTAMRSPLFGILTLEDPSRWLKLQSRHFDWWFESEWEGLSSADMEQLEVDLVQHALDAYHRPYQWSSANDMLFLRMRYKMERKHPGRDLDYKMEQAYSEAYRHWQRILSTNYKDAAGNVLTRMLIFGNLDRSEFSRNLRYVLEDRGESPQAARQWIWDRLVAYVDGQVTPMKRKVIP